MTNILSQTSLFEELPTKDTDSIPGLTYIPNYITQSQEADLLHIIDEQPWLTDLKRRVQHYGWKYDYKARNITEDLSLGALPDWLQYYCDNLQIFGLFPKIPDQVIINEYQPGQGIALHIDCIPCFEETISSLSLSSPCVMEFVNSRTNEKIPLQLEPCSLVVLKGDARYIWKHSIPSRKTDKYNGASFTRSRRLSMTFRNVIANSIF